MNLSYYIFNKPFQVLSQFTPIDDKKCLRDFIHIPHIYSCGRLDYDSEGMLLLTNDGSFINRITDPQHKLPKVYLAQVEGEVSPEALAQLEQGVMIEDKMTLPAQACLYQGADQIPKRDPDIRYRKDIPTSWIKLTIYEGRNRQVRKMTAKVGHPTLRLIRYAIGNLNIKNMEPGELRELTKADLSNLFQKKLSQ